MHFLVHFYFEFAWRSGIENGRDFWLIFSGLRFPGNKTWERGSGGVQSTSVSPSVRETGRDESQSVPSPEKLLK